MVYIDKKGKEILKRITGLLLAISVMLAMIPLNVKAEESDFSDVKESTAEYIYSLLEKNPVYGSEWLVIALARGDYDISDQVFTDYYENLVSTLKEKDGVLSSKRYTEYSKAALAVKAIGRNPLDVGGYNLLSKLTEEEMVENQGINGPVWALIAMEACGYESKVKSEYIDYILNGDFRIKEGGWKLSTDNEKPMDVDLTSMVIIALAPYYETDENVKAAVDSAVIALKEAANDDGTYSENKGGIASVESTAQVVSAFSILRIECIDTVEAVISFKTGNSFGNVMGTEQALLALTAYDRFKSGKCSVYDISKDTVPVVIEAPSKAELEMNALSNERMSLKWNKVSGAKGYQIMFNGKIYTVSSCKKTFNGLTAYKAYKGKIRAFKYVNGEKLYGPWSDEKSVKATYTAPARPAISSLKSGSSKKLTVKWKKVSYAKGYQIGYRKKGGTYKYLYVTSKSKTISKLTSKKVYCVKVRAYKVVNGKKKYGKWSNVKAVKVK